jgi:DNA modification methylase
MGTFWKGIQHLVIVFHNWNIPPTHFFVEDLFHTKTFYIVDKISETRASISSAQLMVHGLPDSAIGRLSYRP